MKKSLHFLWYYCYSTVLSGKIWLELEPEPKLWTKVEPESEPKLDNFGSVTLHFFSQKFFPPFFFPMLLKKRPKSEILPKIRTLKNIQKINPKNEIQKISKKINQKMYSEKLIELTKKWFLLNCSTPRKQLSHLKIEI